MFFLYYFLWTWRVYPPIVARGLKGYIYAIPEVLENIFGLGSITDIQQLVHRYLQHIIPITMNTRRQGKNSLDKKIVEDKIIKHDKS